MLPTLIQRYDKKNHFSFDPLQKRGDLLKFYSLSDATLYDCIIIIYQLIKSFLDK